MDIKSKIIAHYEDKFKQIMLIDKIDPEDIMKSLSIEDNIEKMF